MRHWSPRGTFDGVSNQDGTTIPLNLAIDMPLAFPSGVQVGGVGVVFVEPDVVQGNNLPLLAVGGGEVLLFAEPSTLSQDHCFARFLADLFNFLLPLVKRISAIPMLATVSVSHNWWSLRSRHWTCLR